MITLIDWGGNALSIPDDADGATTATWRGEDGDVILTSNAWWWPVERVLYLPADCQAPEVNNIDPDTGEAVGQWVNATDGTDAVILDGAPRAPLVDPAPAAVVRSMSGEELRARRWALGLDQHSLAEVLGASQATVSLWERGGRLRGPEWQTIPVPPWVADELAALEDQVIELRDRHVDIARQVGADQTVILVHGTDAAFWAAHPECGGIPAACQQVAAAWAAGILRREDGAVVPIEGLA